MGAATVLVAFASQRGSTAEIAEVIAGTLRTDGFRVDCRPASEVESLSPYAALVLGSGVFVRSRATDGGGFLERHAGSLGERPAWLFSAGPIGRGSTIETGDPNESAVMDVAQAIGARGAAAFGQPGGDGAADDVGQPTDMRRVRAWAHEIAAGLGRPSLAAAI